MSAVEIQSGMSQVKNAIAIASGKGGVGKSTVAANLALALSRGGSCVGLMDADIYGPSIPTLLGSNQPPRPGEAEGTLLPTEKFGIKFISMGLFTGRDTPVIWRGPMATKMIQQFLAQVSWGALDYLLIDLPPGTGDVQLTLTQSAPLVGAVIVTTPQEVAVGVTLRGLRMFEQVQVPILGIVENMSTFICPHCSQETQIFRHGGGKRAAEELGVPFLGEVPLDPALPPSGDAGVPVVGAEGPAPEAPSARAFVEIARKVSDEVRRVNEMTRSVSHRPEEVKTENGMVEIRWSDGHLSRYPFRALRQACPCALCVDEWTGQRRMDPERILKSVRPMEIRRVGRYALQFVWSDMHSSGIYTYDLLRSLDPAAPRDVASTGSRPSALSPSTRPEKTP
ncbi:MAG TPA: P-loop NTPase [Candidatus Polarisedimenticolia bacterium]|jgi:ATP-binding protein involved in chromosome partitioning|nr:P-loop NTPase [Candidatus Polarisedimenticolia bacterium]